MKEEKDINSIENKLMIKKIVNSIHVIKQFKSLNNLFQNKQFEIEPDENFNKKLFNFY